MEQALVLRGSYSLGSMAAAAAVPDSAEVRPV
jgi:hypothetical protein